MKRETNPTFAIPSLSSTSLTCIEGREGTKCLLNIRVQSYTALNETGLIINENDGKAMGSAQDGVKDKKTKLTQLRLVIGRKYNYVAFTHPLN